jgi:hypothetical protein
MNLLFPLQGCDVMNKAQTGTSIPSKSFLRNDLSHPWSSMSQRFSGNRWCWRENCMATDFPYMSMQFKRDHFLASSMTVVSMIIPCTFRPVRLCQ